MHVSPATEHQAVTLTRDEFESLAVVDQLKRAFSPGHRLGATIGVMIGGFVPVSCYELVHFEILNNPYLYALIGGALLFSGLSVYRWASSAFNSGWKGLGFVVLCEGTMVASHCRWLALAALALLVVINVASASCALQVRPESTVTSDTSITSLGLSAPNVTPSVQVNVLQSNAVTPAPRQRTAQASQSKSRNAAAERSRRYRERKHLAASQTATA
jgi:hypothetical protein